MKKILLFLTVIGLSLASCSTDEPIGGTSAIEKTNIGFEFASTNSSTTARQDIPRASLPLQISEFNIKAKLVNDAYFVTEDFNLTGNVASGAAVATLKDVALGSNDFTIVTKTNATPRHLLTTTGSSVGDKLTEMKNQVPYMIYTGAKNQTIVKQNNVVPITLTSVYGRVLSVFSLANNFPTGPASYNGYRANVIAKVYKADGTLLATYGDSGSPFVTTNTKVFFEWSDENAVAGNYVKYTVDVQPVNNNNGLHEIYTMDPIYIKGETNMLCDITINKDKVPSNTVQQVGVNVTVGPIRDENCNCND